MADKKRKASDAKTPAKKRKVEVQKKTPSSAKKGTPSAKKVTSTKVKKQEPKKTPQSGKAGNAAKVPQKASKTPTKTPIKKEAAKPAPKKDVKKVETKTVTRAKLVNAKPANTKASVDKAKAIKAKAAAAKAKLKTTKSSAKPKATLKSVQPKTATKPETKAVKKPEAKKVTGKTPDVKKDVSKKAEEKETPKNKATDKKVSFAKSTPKNIEKKPTETPATKRKTAEPEGSAEAPRKKRMITPNKKFADFEVDVPVSSKRTITPNKKYADFETDTSSKRVSELRAFIQDKKKSPPPTQTPKSAKSKSTPAGKSDTDAKEPPAREIKVFKPSEMKPAEKLMKKLQKKLEKEAKSAASPKPSENREKAKIKITKVVTYNKPMSSDEKEMRALKATPKSKTASVVKSVATESPAVKTPKAATAKSNVTKVAKATPKATPKAKAPEKPPPKPKKIKEIKREERPIQAKFLCEKNVQYKDDNDKLSCWITGIGVFPSGEIIMVDMTNRKIKLFSKDFEFLSQVKLDTIPQDISVSPVNASDAYFTKPFSKEGIQRITMSDGKLTLKESFWTNGTNRGITCTKAGILTSVQDGRYHDLDINHFKIDLLDYEGKVLQSVSTDSNGSRLFKLPLYFTVSSSGKQIVVADCIKNFSYVVSLDMTGKVKFKYEGLNNNLITPRGLTIDDEDNIFVTEWERHNVYILSPAGKRTQVLFNDQELREEGLSGLSKPYQLCFYHDGDVKKLIVSQEGCNTVKLFAMSKKSAETDASKAASKAVVEKKVLPNGEASRAKSKSPSPKRSNGEKKATTTNTTLEKSPAKVVTDEKSKEDDKETETESTQTNLPDEPEEPETVADNQTEETSADAKDTYIEANVEQVATFEQDAGVAAEVQEQEVIAITGPAEVTEMEEVETNGGPPTLNAEFGDEFDAADNQVEENHSVQDAINSLNDSNEQIVEPTTTESVVDPNQIEVESFEQVSVPQQISIPQQVTEVSIPQVVTVPVESQQEVSSSIVDVQPEEMQVQEGMEVQQVELMETQYDQIIVPQVGEIMTTQPVEMEIQSVPVESVAHETIIIQQDVNQMHPSQFEKIETVTVNNNEANDILQTETVQYVTAADIGEDYATNIAQGEIVSEMPEEIVTMVTETV